MPYLGFEVYSHPNILNFQLVFVVSDAYEVVLTLLRNPNGKSLELGNKFQRWFLYRLLKLGHAKVTQGLLG